MLSLVEYSMLIGELTGLLFFARRTIKGLWPKTKESFSLSEITALYFFNIYFMGRACYFVFMEANLSLVESLVLGRVINSHEKEQ